VLGSEAARALDLMDTKVGVVVIGHGAPWQERYDLITHFKEALPGVPLLVSLRSRDEPFEKADYNCPADNPALWVRTVAQALQGIS
jgi:hypothetical protein